MKIWKRQTRLPDSKERAELSQLYGKGLKEAKEDFERDLIQKVLEKNDWNVARSAHELKIARTYLYKKIQVYHLGK
jgi:transcriptional regulator with PAS, ATPase and Fis domain